VVKIFVHGDDVRDGIVPPRTKYLYYADGQAVRSNRPDRIVGISPPDQPGPGGEPGQAGQPLQELPP
jgi:hypothetical protein